MKKHIFALDIGTRTVTGIILEKQENNTFEIIDYCMREHKERSMLDGQIHNVLEVAKIINYVKALLEVDHGPLEKVSVAAAGRSLKTAKATATLKLNHQPITDEEAIHHLELSAVQMAQFNLAQKQEETSYENYYCVGYSVLHYKLDGEPIGSLIDQSGMEASVEVIATFLPKIVVESLLATLKRANLTMEALTLEPIAAINVLVPESMRRLNVAIVDIGAGTSDIAITKENTISSYGMVPMAGDLITEAISDRYLLDFNHAEKFKRDIVNEKEATVFDVLGFEQTVTYDELVQTIDDTIDELAYELAEKVIMINERPPQAIMLIGGGSKTPEISKRLAEKLKLPENRVAVRDITAIQNVKTGHLPLSPEFVTPIGIAITAQNNPVNYLSVTVNDKDVRMFEMKQLTIGDCLIQAGYDLKKFYGKPGLALFVTVDGEKLTLPGTLGEAPTLLLNGERADVQANISNGDRITIEKGKDGEQASLTIEQLLGDHKPITVFLNEKKYTLKPQFFVNNRNELATYTVRDKDEITFQHTYTIREFFDQYQMKQLDDLTPFYVHVNGDILQLEKGQRQILLNESPASLETILNDQDKLLIKEPEPVTVKEVLKMRDENFWQTVHVTFNGEKVILKQERLTVTRNDKTLGENDPLYPGDKLTIKPKKIKQYIFQDVFRFVDIKQPTDKTVYELFKNDTPCSFHERIIDGDRLELKWTK